MIAERRVASAGACVLFLLAAFALFFRQVLFHGQVPVFRDILDTTVPLGHYIGARLREGRLPQWFPYEGLGQPFIGQLNESTFHPGRWLYAVLPLAAALRWEMLLAYLAAALGQLLFARRLGLSWTASVLAASAFAFSGYALSLSNLIPYLWAMATLPWVGACALEVCRSERPWPWVAALALCWATIVLAGDSHSALFGGVVAFFCAAHTGRWRRLPLCMLAAAIALGLSGAELLPAIDIVRAGPRARWSDVRALSSTWSLHPHRLPELLLPNWFPPFTAFLFASVRYHEGGLWALSIYPGTPVIALAVAGLAGRRRTGVLAACLALLALWLASGAHGGLEPLLRRLLPLLNLLRYPEKHLALWTVALPIAAGAGLDRLRAGHPRAVPIAIAAVAGGCAVAGLALPAGAATQVWPQIAQSPEDIALLHEAWRSALLAAGASLGILAVLLALSRLGFAALVLAPLLVAGDLWLANRTVIGLADGGLLEGPSPFCVAATGAGAGPAGLRAMNVAAHARLPAEMLDPRLWAKVTLNGLLPVAGATCGIGSAAWYPLLSNEFRAVRAMFGTEHLESNPAMALYGFGILVRVAPEDPPVPGETVIASLELEPGRTLILARRPAAPRTWAAVPRWVPDPAAARREVLEHGLGLVDSPVLTGSGPSPAGKGPAGEVRIATYQPEHVVLEARMSRPGAVILNDLASRGWTATVDGQPAEIHRANVLVRGVLVPEGSHRIEMSYQLPRLRAGIAASLGSLLLCVLLAAWGRRRAATPEAA